MCGIIEKMNDYLESFYVDAYVLFPSYKISRDDIKDIKMNMYLKFPNVFNKELDLDKDSLPINLVDELEIEINSYLEKRFNLPKIIAIKEKISSLLLHLPEDSLSNLLNYYKTLSNIGGYHLFVGKFMHFNCIKEIIYAVICIQSTIKDTTIEELKSYFITDLMGSKLSANVAFLNTCGCVHYILIKEYINKLKLTGKEDDNFNDFG